MPTLEDLPTLDELPVGNLATDDLIPVWDVSTRSIRKVRVDTFATDAETAAITAESLGAATPASVDAAIDAYSVNNSLTLVVNDDDTVSGYAFTAIPDSEFVGSAILAAQLGSSVTSIGSYAFFSCTSLTSITIPNSVTTIGSYAFYNCSNLASITIPNSVTTIGSYAFFYCSSLTSVTIPDSVTSLSDNVFYNCSGLASVNIGNSVTSIGSASFAYCTSLASITIPDSVTSIGNYTFFGCSSLNALNCNVTRTIINQSNVLGGCATPFTLHARASDGTWTAGADTIGGLAVTVVKDL